MARKLDTQPKFRREWLARLLALFTSGLIGALVWPSPFGAYLETNFGLWWSFKMRGPRAPPPEVVVVPIREESARVLSQPSIDDLDDWNRALFAQVVNRLAAGGASVIAFDIAFRKASSKYPNGDDLFAEAIFSAKNVILLRWLNQKRTDVSTPDAIAPQIDQLVDPPHKFSETAAAIAPWLLPEGDERIHRFPTFPYIASRIAPTLPVAALYLHQRPRTDLSSHCAQNTNVHSKASEPIIADMGRSEGKELVPLRNWLQELQRGDLFGISDSLCKQLDLEWIAAQFNLNNEKLFNYYGKAGALVGPPFHDLIGDQSESLAKRFQGKAVFIGVARNEIVQPLDNFPFPFAIAGGGGRISGVELAATAFANLLGNEDVKKVDPAVGLSLVLGFGMAAGLIGYLLPARPAISVAVIFSALYVAGAQYLFKTNYLWLPLVVPVLIQMPLAIAFGWQLRYLMANHTKRLLEQYVPEHARRRIDKEGRISTEPQLFYAVSLHSDIAGYSGVSERYRFEPLALKRLETEYWDMVHQQIASAHGERLDISGDGMTCIWTKDSPKIDPHQQACQGALQILRAIDRFNANHPDTPFETRIGLHAGQIALGTIGSDGQYTLAAGGDVTTTAARLENDVNKLLATRLALSKEVMSELPGVNARRLGRFILRGRTSETIAYELCEDDAQSKKSQLVDFSKFEAALSVFERGQWQDALDLFDLSHAQHREDGPTLFYLRLATLYLDGEQAPQDPRNPGVIDMNEKWIQAHLGG